MHGYSSSEESEDPRRPRPAPASTSTTTDQKKKKKKKPAPQQSINHIWRKFQSRKPNTAIAVLPFDPVQPPATLDRANEAASAGYRRAAEECRRKVQKIVKECKRVNMRYRDPGWDLDWDLLWAKGNCLNSLGRYKFEVSRSPSDSSATSPKAVKRVHQIFEKPTFMKDIDPSDVVQGSLGNCWLLAALSALASTPDGVRRLCVEYNTKVGIYGFVFYRDGEWVYSIIDDKLYLKSPNWDSQSLQRDLLSQIDREDVEHHYRKTYQTGSKALFFAKNKDQNETWLPLLEKAYAKAHGDFASLVGGWIGEGLEDLSGGVTTELLTSDILDEDAFWDDELSKVNEEFLFGCSTGLLDGGYGQRNGISERHAYVLMDARTLKSGQRLLKLRNPWGKTRKGIWEGPWSDGSKEWTTDVQQELGHSFGSDSVFWISYEDFLRKYQHFDRTRLFRDPSWRCCQRWIGVDVLWKPSYHEKFHIKLTEDSPLVLVLSQLDDRYFKGLRGQYTFRLHFRLHEKDRPGAEDYIVRSHGNYLMSRSVSIEIPDMPAGDYSVFISVAGERDTNRSSVEDVVKRECKGRVENDKLAQVGYAYDLAHSKAHAHLELVKKLRLEAEAKKASESRMKERRKMWERRCINRDVVRKQQEKNEAKKQKKREEELEKKKQEIAKAAAEAERAAEEEKDEEETEREDTQDEDVDPKQVKEEDKTDDGEVKEEAKDAKAEEKSEPKTDDDKAEAKDDTEPPKVTDDAPEETKAETSTSDEKPAGDAKKSLETNERETIEPESELTDKKTDEEVKEKAAEESKDSDKPDSIASSNSSGSPQYTPSSTSSTVAPLSDKEPVPPVEGPPPPPPAPPSVKSEDIKDESKEDNHDSKDEKVEKSAKDEKDDTDNTDDKKPEKAADDKMSKAKAKKKVKAQIKMPTIDDIAVADSSDSPVSDWENLYSDDDMVRKPRQQPYNPTTQADRYPSEDESLPDPWNAVCVIGFRVYSKDENLELRVVMEGGEFLEGGMGEKGARDLDDAQENAAGDREGDDACVAKYPTVVIKGEDGTWTEQSGEEDGDDESEDEKKAERKSKKEKKKKQAESKKVDEDVDGEDFVTAKSGASTPGIDTPAPTPMPDDGKELC